jgi:hypothetical protein
MLETCGSQTGAYAQGVTGFGKDDVTDEEEETCSR